MAEIRIVNAAKEFNVSAQTIIESLQKNGFAIENKPTAKLNEEMYRFVSNLYASDKAAKEESKSFGLKLKKQEDTFKSEDFGLKKKEDIIAIEEKQKQKIESEKLLELQKQTPIVETPKMEIKIEVTEPIFLKTKINVPPVVKIEETSIQSEKLDLEGITVEGKIDLSPKKTKKLEKPAIVVEKIIEQPKVIPIIEEPIPEEKRELIKTQLVELDGLSIKGKIELRPDPFIKPRAFDSNREKRKRKTSAIKVNIQQEIKDNRPKTTTNKFEPKKVVNPNEVKTQLKTTLNKIGFSGRGKTVKSKFKKQKRDLHGQNRQDELDRAELEEKILKVTEFLTANDLSKMMDVQVVDVISTCFTLGIMVSINQRLDAETITLVADEFGFEVEFVDAETTIAFEDDKDDETKLMPRPPIVTVMGHVDHGKTSLLDYVRKANVIAGEAGGITQHIGAYEVTLPQGEKITFLDTPGHEAFTAMRARGAKVTDIAVIVIAADDSLMPQTREAISHAQAANVPMIFAINKMDKDGANPEKIREELSAMNILVEEWGGKFQSQEISAKKGLNIDKLLEKILLEAELLDLKAVPDRNAKGTIVESRLDKGRGIVANVLIQNGTLRVGDHLVAGSHYAKVKALFNERNVRVDFAGPSTPVSMLGFSDSPTAGDPVNVLATEDEAKELANKRTQLLREQGIRTTKHITLDEIGRRLAIGNFKELNLIVKGDVNGSVEALSDSLLNLGNEEVQVKVILRGVGQITESDVLLASASDAIIVGFQVRPSSSAKKLAEAEQIDIRHYSIIYQAIDEIKSAIEGMLSPEIKETVIGNVEVREVFKITKIGVVAGCMVTDGKVTRQSKVRIIRDGVVVHQGSIEALKRFKDDVKDVMKGFECGISIKNFSDIQNGDNFEIYEEVSIARKLV